MKDDLRYTPSDCFETFPFPPSAWESSPPLERVGEEYHGFRAALMIRHDEGLTKTYNRFHDPDETSPDILRLRALHDAMDRAVLDAYGWTDLRPTCEFLLDYEDEDDENDDSGRTRQRKKPWRAGPITSARGSPVWPMHFGQWRPPERPTSRRPAFPYEGQ